MGRQDLRGRRIGMRVRRSILVSGLAVALVVQPGWADEEEERESIPDPSTHLPIPTPTRPSDFSQPTATVAEWMQQIAHWSLDKQLHLA